MFADPVTARRRCTRRRQLCLPGVRLLTFHHCQDEVRPVAPCRATPPSVIEGADLPMTVRAIMPMKGIPTHDFLALTIW